MPWKNIDILHWMELSDHWRRSAIFPVGSIKKTELPTFSTEFAPTHVVIKGSMAGLSSKVSDSGSQPPFSLIDRHELSRFVSLWP